MKWPKGHIPWNIGIHPSEETKYKIGSANRGKTLSDEIKKKMSQGHIGQNTWSKGSHPSDETRKKMSESQKGHVGFPCSEETKRKLSEMFKGRIVLEEIKQKMSKTHIGMKQLPETCEKIRILKTGMKYSEDTKNKLREVWKNRTLELKNKMIKAMLTISIPNKKEIWLMDLLEGLYPGEWKFVGDGQVIIEGKCPDFININGQKKIIELWGDHWHRAENPQDRADIFAPFGYQTLIVRQSELKDVEAAKDKIRAFCESEKENKAA